MPKRRSGLKRRGLARKAKDNRMAKIFAAKRKNKAADAMLLQGCALGKLDLMGKALRNGADVNARSEDGQSALALAAASGNLAGVALLCQTEGTEIGALDGQGRNALMAAAEAGRVECFEALLARIDPAGPDAQGRDAMYYALLGAKSGTPKEAQASAMIGMMLRRAPMPLEWGKAGTSWEHARTQGSDLLAGKLMSLREKRAIKGGLPPAKPESGSAKSL